LVQQELLQELIVKKNNMKEHLLLLLKVSVDQLMGVTGLGQSSGQLTPANPSLVKAVATVNSQNLLMFLQPREKYLSDNSITQPLLILFIIKMQKEKENLLMIE
jgi:hypothetical protein